MERTTLSFTAENLLTVCLMVFLGFTAYGLLARLVYKGLGNGNA